MKEHLCAVVMICCRSSSNHCDSYSELHDDGGQMVREEQCRFDAEEHVPLNIKEFRWACNDDFDDSPEELPLSGYYMTTVDEIAMANCTEVRPPFQRYIASSTLHLHQYIPVKEDISLQQHDDYAHRSLIKFKDTNDGDLTDEGEADTEGSDMTGLAGTADLFRASGDQDTESEQAQSDEPVEVLFASTVSEAPSIDEEELYSRGWPQASLVSVHVPSGTGDKENASMRTLEMYSKGWPQHPLWSFGVVLRQSCMARQLSCPSISEEYPVSDSTNEVFPREGSRDVIQAREIWRGGDHSIPIAASPQKPQSSLLTSQNFLKENFSAFSYPEPKIVAVL